MKWYPIRAVWAKELRDTIRDRRTLLVMVLMPVVITPLLIVGAVSLVKSQAEAAKNATKKCALVGAESIPELEARVRTAEKFEFIQGADAREAEEKVRQGDVHVALVVPEEAARQLQKAVETAKVQVYYKGTVIQSTSAYLAVAKLVDDYGRTVVKTRLKEKGMSDEAIEPIKVEDKNVSSKQEMGGLILGFIVPMLVVVWSIVGGMYTAMDVSAGEKERNTLESLMLTPASRLEVTLGKLGAVSTVGFFTMVAALGSMYLAFTCVTLPTPVAGGGDVDPNAVKFHVSLVATLLMLGLSMLLVISFSSLMVGLGVFARSVKEAQNLIMPLYILTLMPVMATSFVESEHASVALFLIPGVNTVLLFKELLKNQFVTAHILTTAAGLGGCMLAAILFTVETFRRETVLFKS